MLVSHFPKLPLFEPSGASVSKYFLLGGRCNQCLIYCGFCVSFSLGLLSFPRVWLALSSLSSSVSLFLCPHGPGQVPPSPRCLVAVDCTGW